MDCIRDIAGGAAPLPTCTVPWRMPPRAKLGVALDGSFNFYYIENLRRLEDAGLEFVYFSPETASVMPEVDGLYVGGVFRRCAPIHWREVPCPA